MAEQIKDGTGGGHLVAVTDHNRLKTDSMTMDQATHYSQTHESLYSWTTLYDAGAGDFVLCLRNNDPDSHLCIETFRVCNDTATAWALGFGTWATVGGGAEIVGVNAHGNAGHVAQATCYKAASNFTADTVPFLQSLAGANAERTYRPEGKIVLGYLDVIYIKTSVASASNVSATIWGFFKEIE